MKDLHPFDTGCTCWRVIIADLRLVKLKFPESLNPQHTTAINKAMRAMFDPPLPKKKKFRRGIDALADPSTYQLSAYVGEWKESLWDKGLDALSGVWRRHLISAHRQIHPEKWKMKVKTKQNKFEEDAKAEEIEKWSRS